MSTSEWLSVRVRPGREREAVIAALFGAGAAGLQEMNDDLLTQLPADTDVGALTEAVRAASADATIETTLVPAIDWSEKWKQSIHVQQLGALAVAPPWLADGLDPARTIVIEPGMAFGTGEHATTRGVIRLMPGVVGPGDSVADLGAGSAVLSIAAAKLGAARVAAIEIDPDAIGNAEENVARNDVAGRVVVLEGDAELLLPLVAPVNVVLANILSSVLVSLLPAIGRALTDDGRAILSGILLSEREELLPVLETMGWRIEAEDREELWWTAAIARR